MPAGAIAAAGEAVAGEDGASTDERAAQAFLAALDTLTAKRRNVSHARHAASFAPRVMVAARLVPGFTIAELEAGMALLFRQGRIVAAASMPWRRHDGHSVTGVSRAR